MLSVIIPAYNEELMVKKAARVIDRVLGDENIPHELILWTMAPGTAHGSAFRRLQRSFRRCAGCGFPAILARRLPS